MMKKFIVTMSEIARSPNPLPTADDVADTLRRVFVPLAVDVQLAAVMTVCNPAESIYCNQVDCVICRGTVGRDNLNGYGHGV